MNNNWECKKCGSCCKIVGYFIEEFNSGDGSCKKLNKDNLCSIYHNRPYICRVKSKDSKIKNMACSFARNNIGNKDIIKEKIKWL